MAERFSASNLCSDGQVIRMWVRILAAIVVLVFLNYYVLYIFFIVNCFLFFGWLGFILI